MRSILFAVLTCLILFPVAARAERASLEFAGGIGDTNLLLREAGREIYESSTSLWRVRGRLVMPLSPQFAALLSYERAGDGAGRVSYYSGGTAIVSQERFGFFEIGFRISL